MGDVHEDLVDHEGHPVGFTVQDGCDPDSGLYRELAYPRDEEPCEVLKVSAGCTCGWRSSRWTSGPGTTYVPFSVELSERDEDRVRALWDRHALEARSGQSQSAA